MNHLRSNGLKTCTLDFKPICLALILGIFFLAAGILPGFPTGTARAGNADEEALIKQARELIAKDEVNHGNMQQAAAILESCEARGTTDIRVPLYLAEAYYRMADSSQDIGKTYHIYEKTGAYAEKALRIDPNSPEAHYWNGLSLLKKAQKIWGIKAYSTTKSALKELELVRSTMPSCDHGGASRVLGLVYYYAPGWTPFGDIKKAVKMQQEATRIDPGYALNHLYLADAYYKQGDKSSAFREYQAVLSIASKQSGRQAEGFAEKAQKMLSEEHAATSKKGKTVD